ncbi:hypothetical protein Mal64_01210 [Pseudobythopirellula maris]|uniref:Sulfotransferase domain protein n=1 Tax=Pseudobythopirellula maris TaxID=2527991 RepID=A0A5C5ZQD4_9BACT|nr:sulfotransferase [Pseudobythopirellula maris]TWT89742.1 hypothetical protein Mal64_01210 [Pseudobythopirellula maris]
MVTNSPPSPRFVFVFGAVGSGNTFMCSCLVRDSRVYGVNEDAFGATLERLVQSEKEFGSCPHSLEAFVRFLDDLRRDRSTLVLKTPSNLRRLDLIRKHLEGARFVYMIREPHAAIASGLERHGLPPEGVADLWAEDARRYLSSRGSDMIAVAYESLTRAPREALERVAAEVMPLDEGVMAYAEQSNRPERSSPNWWRERVGPAKAAEIEAMVASRSLGELYQEITGEQAATPLIQDGLLTRLRKGGAKALERLKG